MKRGHLIILLLIFNFYNLHGQSLYHLRDRWADFIGVIGKSKVNLSIYIFDDSTIKGNYYYDKYKIRIPLIGQINDGKFELIEGTIQKPTGYFLGYYTFNTEDSLEGLWTDSSRERKIRFGLKLDSYTIGDYQEAFYENNIIGLPDEVERFMKKVKDSIFEGNKEWVANHIYYPIQVSLNGVKTVSLKNKEEFLHDYDQIFYPQFLATIKGLRTFNLYDNSDGVMLGDGYIYINNTKNSTEDKYSFCITQINNEKDGLGL